MSAEIDKDIYELKQKMEQLITSGVTTLTPPKGWECPSCHKILAPSVKICKPCSDVAAEQVENKNPAVMLNEYNLLT